MAELPSGTVAFLFSDIEGSTQLLTRLRGGYADVLTEHHGVLRAAFDEYNGREIGTQGDGFFVAFARASEAIAAAIAAQRGLVARCWPERADVRVRMGVHIGEAALGLDSYIGLDVHRAARICSAGHGGQVLISNATRELVEGVLPPDVVLKDLGEYRLKGLERPEHLFQVVAGGLPADFPPPVSLAPVRSSGAGTLPPSPNRTIGRDDDVLAIAGRLRAGSVRLLTLTGPGGVGKTRLATEVARAAGGRFVGLAPIAGADRIPAVVCDALGVARVPDESDTAALDRALAPGPLLLVLDNLEHLPDAALLIADLLERHPALTVLATSRHPLRLRAERLYPVAPLTGAGAVDLFADRARARDPGFVADDAVAEICERVGGLPLAIELAAARLGVLTPSQLAERLANELGVLDRGPRDAPERQRTLRATLDWSFELLDDEERRAFSALGVFAGGCDVEAAEAVTGSPLTTLEELVDKSLMVAGAGRLTMLEPIRQYAAERLAERPDANAVRLRHLLHYLSVAQRCEEPVWVRHRSCPEFGTLQREHENLRAAITWGLASGEALRVVELLAAIAFYVWYSHDRTGQLRRWRDRALAAAGDDLPLGVRARAEFAVGFNSSDRGERFRHDLAALALFRELGDDTMVARCLVDLAMTARFDRDPAGAVAYAEEAVQHARRVADDGLIGAALAELSASTLSVEAAAPLARAAVTHLRAADAHELAAQVLSELCLVAALEDAHETVEQLGREAEEAAAAVGDTWTIAYVQGNVAATALLGDRHDAARVGFQDELMTAVAHALPAFSRFDPLYGMAALAGAAGDDRRAAVLAGAASAIDALPVSPAARPIYNRLEQRFLAPARERLGDEEWETASAEGRRMEAGAAAAYALQPTLLSD